MRNGNRYQDDNRDNKDNGDNAKYDMMVTR